MEERSMNTVRTTMPGGLRARTAIFAFNARHSYTSPVAAILCADVSQSMYTHMVCNLCRRHDVQRAVERASSTLLRRHGAAVLDYTTRTCAESVPGHYVVYTTTTLANDEAAAVGEETLDRCCLEMENALSAVYRQCRVADGSIGPLEVRVVRPGTFEELTDHAVSSGASAGQYKVPRCVTDHPAIIELLNSHRVAALGAGSGVQMPAAMGIILDDGNQLALAARRAGAGEELGDGAPAPSGWANGRRRRCAGWASLS
ncbi:hypothetical protein ACP70R_003940 [Stipagrostis hirtigluma subsp. patula]